MVTETGQVQPTNKIVVDSTGIHHQTKKVQTNTDVYPGRLVIKGTNDDDVVCGTSGGAVYGWVGYNDTNKKYRPATISTIQTGDDQVDIVNGPGIIVLGWLLSGEAATKGAVLYPAAGGFVQVGAYGNIIAIAEETVTATTLTTRLLCRSLI